MPKSEKDKALVFLASIRGQYIVGQALAIASQQLKDSDPSNASDMRYLMTNLFTLGAIAEQAKDLMKLGLGPFQAQKRLDD